MKSAKLALAFLAFLSVVACKTTKKAETTPPVPQPEWVKSRPISNTHYIGIGWARKTVDVNQYQQAAKQNAQADLAGEISVNVSSNSVLYAFESNTAFRDDYISTIRTEIQEDLEAFEVVDSWEDQSSYWVYYRLSKAEHQRLKELKKSNAVTRSLDLLEKGISAREAGNVRLALVHLIQAMEPIKPYLSETLPAEFRGKSIFLGNEIFGDLFSTLSSIEISPAKNEIETKTGKGLTQEQLLFVANEKTHGPVYELPVVAAYSEKPIRNNQKRTDRKGAVAFDVDIVRSTKSFEIFTVSVDIDALIIEATADQFIRKLVKRLTIPEGNLRINIQKPVMQIFSSESVFDEKQKSESLKETLQKKAIEAGYLVKDDSNEVDYIVRITTTTVRQGDTGAYKNVIMKGSISVETPQGNQLYHKLLDEIKGTHFDYKQANEEAYKEARRRIELSIFREINEAIKKK